MMRNFQLEEYFEYFSNKDIENLRSMFSRNIVLIDGKEKYFGKIEVIDAVKNIFSLYSLIEISILNIYCNSSNSYLASLRITFDSDIVINLIDLIIFNNIGKIEKIEVFRLVN